MCTASVARAGFFNNNFNFNLNQRAEESSSSSGSDGSRSRPMKLPRVGNAFSTTSNACRRELAQHQDASSPAAGSSSRRDAQTTPRASGSAVRRCQSANAASGRPTTRRSVLGGAYSSYSANHPNNHAQEAVPTRHQQAMMGYYYSPASNGNKTRELPIPASERGSRPSRAHEVDCGDLVRMYDYATWNMYERIVSARRSTASQRRASERDVAGASLTKKEDTSRASSSSGVRTLASKPNNGGSDEGTTSTADETDRGSTASESWSRPDSPAAFPTAAAGGAQQQKQHHPYYFAGYERAVSSCPPPGANNEDDEDEHFIFQLDL